MLAAPASAFVFEIAAVLVAVGDSTVKVVAVVVVAVVMMAVVVAQDELH